MASAQVNHKEEYAKIATNLANIKNVWGTSSRQFAEADAMATEYLRTFLGPVKASTEVEEGQRAISGSHGSGPARTLNLVFRPKVPR